MHADHLSHFSSSFHLCAIKKGTVCVHWVIHVWKSPSRMSWQVQNYNDSANVTLVIMT